MSDEIPSRDGCSMPFCKTCVNKLRIFICWVVNLKADASRLVSPLSSLFFFVATLPLFILLLRPGGILQV
jgi:hypothetical protein